MSSSVIKSGSQLPAITLSTLSGDQVTLGQPESGRYQLLVVYRGIHCPICESYLGDLNEKRQEFESKQVDVLVASTNGQKDAKKFAEKIGLNLTVAYGLTLDQAQSMGLYISDPIESDGISESFAEPGLFLTRPDGKLQLIDIANGPFCRPDLKWLLKGMEYVVDKDYPIRGTHAP